jgi:hypothetical protein
MVRKKRLGRTYEPKTQIGSGIYFPNHSGRHENCELRDVNLSTSPWTSYGQIKIDIEADTNALVIDSEATTQNLIFLNEPVLTEGVGIKATGFNSLTTGKIASFQSNSDDTDTRELVNIENSNSLATSAKCLQLKQVSSADGLFIDMDGNGKAISIDTESTTVNVFEINTPQTETGICINVTNANSLTTGRAFNIYANGSNTSTRTLLQIYNDHATSINATPLGIRQDSNRRALFIDMNGNRPAIKIDCAGTTDYGCAIDIEGPATTSGNVMRIINADNLTTGRLLQMSSNSSDSSNRFLVGVHNQNASSTGTKCFRVQQESTGAGILIDFNGATGNSIEIDQDSNDGGNVYAIKINHNNAGGGLPGALDMSPFARDEPLFKVVNDAITNPGTLTKQIAIEVGGTVYYLYAYTTGT